MMALSYSMPSRVLSLVFKVKKLTHALHDAKQKFYNASQGKFMTPPAYLEQFKNVVEVISHCGCRTRDDPGLIQLVHKENGMMENGLATE
jgi:hypothetical protein